MSINWSSLVTVVVQKTYSKMHPVLSTNTDHDVADLVNHGMLKNTKTWIYLRKEHNFSTKKKFLLTCASDDTFWYAELELRVHDSWIMNQFPNFTNQKVCKTYILHKLFFPKYDIFKIISMDNICLFICLELNEWNWMMKE